ncbi:uncharacterized protein TNCV_3815291 [Trichonephila clavipes]|nr:uncharacterized protein TNCV_3815291 [Trichonephila clavipes]
MSGNVWHCRRSGASLWERNCTSKSLVVIGIPPTGCRTKKRLQLTEVCNIKIPIRSPIEEKKHFVYLNHALILLPTPITEWAVGSLVVRASDSRPEGLGSMLDVTKYPPSAHGFTCRNCGGGDRGRVAIYRPFGEVPLSLNRTVTCMVLKANDRRTSCPYHDEFRGPRSDYVRQLLKFFYAALHLVLNVVLRR